MAKLFGQEGVVTVSDTQRRDGSLLSAKKIA
jgi:hypothetical protein